MLTEGSGERVPFSARDGPWMRQEWQSPRAGQMPPHLSDCKFVVQFDPIVRP